MTKKNQWVGLLIIAVLLAGCGPSAVVARSAPSPTLAPTIELLPTVTPIVTATPIVLPTATAEPTATPEPTAMPLTLAQPIGQHPYTLTLQLTSTNGLTQSFTAGFLLYLPRAYGQDSSQTWPLILFLHGSAENGDDPQIVAANALPQLLTGDVNFPFVVVSPQAPDGVVWWGTELDQVAALLDYVEAKYTIDPKREYLTGISMGGFGAWAMVMRYPKRFAAVVPIAGGWNSEDDSIPWNICDIKTVPIWVFHGEQDEIVSPHKSQLMVDALQKCGSDVKFTLYPDADHRGSWQQAYSDPAMYEWLLAQHLP